MKRAISIVSLLMVFGSAALAASVMTLTPKTSFSGDGFLAPDEDPNIKLSTGNLERGLAYNPKTGHLILLSRQAGIFPQILDGNTGAFIGYLRADQAALTGGGTFLGNMVGVDEDGRIWMCNLITSAGSFFSVYRWDDETPNVNPTLVYSATQSVPRVGDTFDVIGGGSNVSIVAGAGTGGTGFVYSNDSAGSFTAVTGASPAADYRLGITFTDALHVYGTGTTNAGPNGENQAKYYDIANSVVLGDGTLSLGSERLMDYAVVNGVPVLAVQETTVTDHRVRVYDVSNPLAPAFRASLRTDDGNVVANGNGCGQVKFGAINGNKAVLYAMSTNMGVQAMELTVDVTQPISGTLNLGAVDPTWASAKSFNYELRSGATVVESGTLQVDANFQFTINTAATGTNYDLWIKGVPFLGKSTAGVSPGDTGLNISMVNGDIDGDNAVTVFDYNALSDAFDTADGDPGWNPDADLDGDGAVTVFDYNVLSDNFDAIGDE